MGAGHRRQSRLRLRNLHDPILPFAGVRSGPYQHQRLNDTCQGCPLLDEKDARTLALRFQKTAEVARHRPEIGRDKNPILLGGESEHLSVGKPFQPGLVCRKKIDCRLTPETPADDRMVEARIREEADHPLASSQAGLPQTLKRHGDFRRCWMGSSESILCPLTFRTVPFYFFLTSKIEGNCSINLFEAECRIVGSNGLRGFPMLKFPDDVG
jgi:hypothetical protein